MSEPRCRLSKKFGLVVDGVTVCTPDMICADGIIIENDPLLGSYIRLTIHTKEPLSVASDVPFNIGALHPGRENVSLSTLEPYEVQAS